MGRSRRVALAGTAGVLAATGLLAMVVTAGEPRPVDVRRVDLSPGQPGVLSATFTTTVRVLPSLTAVLVAPPPRKPEPTPVTTTTQPPPPPPPTATTEPAPPTTTTTPKPTPSRGKPPVRCDEDDPFDRDCPPWVFPPPWGDWCDWPRLHGTGHPGRPPWGDYDCLHEDEDR
ncbi:hypothetical protein [Saccharothrix obliqua]|uniref:hypothetical protein n=1 Tax=Saccharothrix obliqua TaxID=2861747 RepID=UPI001C5F3FD1|nr:hypothetical protein [Saccharothrix obliqua]MBW4715771.1 hypothetical protein [Saccharothrix obliqua]